jgi:hypothetical protein
MTSRDFLPTSRSLRSFLGSAFLASCLFGGAEAYANPDGAAKPFVTSTVGAARLLDLYDDNYKHVRIRKHEISDKAKAAAFKGFESEGYLVMNLPKVEEFLNWAAHTCIVKQSPQPHVRVSIKVAGVPAEPDLVQIKAHRSGAIMFTPKALSLADTPEKLMFIIAHEVGHVVMEHYEDPTKVVLDQEVADKLQNQFSLSILRSVATHKKGEEPNKINNIIMLGQEDHADFFAIDMMDKCGYGIRKGPLILSQITTWETGIKAGTMHDSQDRLEDTVANADSSSNPLVAIFGGLAEAMMNAPKQISEAMSQTYREEGDRRRVVQQYIDAYYGGRGGNLLSMMDANADSQKLRDLKSRFRVYWNSQDLRKTFARYDLN